MFQINKNFENNTVPILNISLDELEADVIIPNNRMDFEFMWRNKIFDFMPHDSNDKYLFNFDVKDKDWIFENREALNYMSAQDLWRSSPTFFKINQLVYKMLSSSYKECILEMKLGDNIYKGIKQDKLWDFSNNNNNIEKCRQKTQLFCKIAEYSDIIRSEMYISKLLELYITNIDC